jgi:hypothetical protein
MRSLTVMLLLLYTVLGGCMKTQRGAQNAVVSPKAPEHANVGKSFWVKRILKLCGQPATPEAANCESLNPGTKVTVTGLAAGAVPSIVYYQLRLEDDRTGFVIVAEFAAGTSSKDPVIAAAECKRQGDPRIGMTVEQAVTTCWGRPNHVNRTQTGDSISDQFVYDDRGNLYFRDGVLTEIQATGTAR